MVCCVQQQRTPCDQLKVLTSDPCSRFSSLVKDYCGSLSEKVVQMNFALIYELLDEVLVSL